MNLLLSRCTHNPSSMHLIHSAVYPWVYSLAFTHTGQLWCAVCVCGVEMLLSDLGTGGNGQTGSKDVVNVDVERKTKNGVRDTCCHESYYWTPINTYTWPMTTKATITHTVPLYVHEKVFYLHAHPPADMHKGARMCLTSLCVLQTNHHHRAHALARSLSQTRTHTGKGVAAESWVIYRCTSWERGRQRGSVSDGERERARSKERSELTGQVIHLILSISPMNMCKHTPQSPKKTAITASATFIARLSVTKHGGQH